MTIARIRIPALTPALLLAAAAAMAMAACSPAPEGAPAAAAGPARVRVIVDPRVELLSIVFRLAGNNEYTQGRVPAYVKAVDEHFATVRDHPVVARAIRLRETRGIGFDAPMKLAICLDGIDALRLRPGRAEFPLTEDGDTRWTPEETAAFLAELRDFAAAADVRGFLASQEDVFEVARMSLETAVADAGIPEWLQSFFGASSDAELIACVGLLNGGPCYGPSARPAGGRDEFYCILGTPGDAEGRPHYPPEMLVTAVHEFVHSYANPLVDVNMDRLAAPGETLFAAVKPAMERQAYGIAQTMLRESLVRACTARYILAKRGPEAAAAVVASDVKRSFVWMEDLFRALDEYEGARDRFPDLAAFMPRVDDFFDDYAAARLPRFLEEKARRAEEIRAKSPRIVSIVPPDGARDVDPACDAIVITFDRPMVRGNLAVMIVDGAYPGDSERRASFDETGRVLTLPVKLSPGTDYAFGLNGEDHLVMRDADGNDLAPVVVRFRTRD